MDGCDSPNSTYGLRNHQRTPLTGDALIQKRKHPYGLRNQQGTAVTGDAWIRHPTQPLWTLKSATNCYRG